MTNLSIVIPVYRSEESLIELTARLASALKEFDYEIILVDDCSPDRSWTIIQELCRMNPRLRGLALRKNVGQDGALMAGLRISCGDLVVIMDDDLQQSPSDIPLLVKSIGDQDICYASFAQKSHAIWKNIGSWLNGKMAELILDKPKHLYFSPFKIMSRGLVDEVCRYSGAYPYIDGLVLRSTSKINQIAVNHFPRPHGRSNYNFIRSFRVSIRHLTGFSVHPLRFASLLGVWVSMIGFALLVYFIAGYFMGSDSPAGWTSLATILLCVSGVILLSLGVIGEYVGRAYLNINQKPQYSIWKSVEAKRFKD